MLQTAFVRKARGWEMKVRIAIFKDGEAAPRNIIECTDLDNSDEVLEEVYETLEEILNG
jgi:hypothetical protein